MASGEASDSRWSHGPMAPWPHGPMAMAGKSWEINGNHRTKWAFSKPCLITGCDIWTRWIACWSQRTVAIRSVWQEIYTWKISDGIPPTRLQTAAHLLWILPQILWRLMSMGLKKCYPASCSARCLKAACALAMRPIHPAADPFGSMVAHGKLQGRQNDFRKTDVQICLIWGALYHEKNQAPNATCHESGGFFVKWPQHPSRLSPKLAPALGSRHVAKLPWASTWHYNCWNLRALTDNTLGVQQPTPKPNSFQK